ncbi:trans-sulfuration enzyme family protein [Ensifer aridi]|uniref:trans-sulfuration enzyme family protein n=1 Tax=Ensifer aridi TaxID=1708715 RepID=UPI000A122C9F|nr:aminotransferase class I/II-fold pyridoxal phosphate-dependent enzyme [Ensifer aridi]
MRDQTIIVSKPEISTSGFDSLGVPTHRAATIVFASTAEYENRSSRGHQGYSYGLYGTPTTRALEHRITLLENGVRTFLTPSGQASNALALLSLLEAGDRILICDNVYPAVRDFAERDLKRFGIRVDYYDPLRLDELEGKLDPTVKIVWCESPGSTTMEVADLPELARLAHAVGAIVGCDNTWATPLYFKPLDHGADIVTEALTKYFGGHSDVFMGSLTVKNEALIQPVRATLGRHGIGVSPDDASMVLRGMETMSVRICHSARVALDMARWLEGQPCVEAVLFPPLPSSPGHATWARDFSGASGVFSVVFKKGLAPHVGRALDTLGTFVIGASWGGTRSLVAPMKLGRDRSVTAWPHDDLVLRFSVGLEAEEELWADIERLALRLNGIAVAQPAQGHTP